MAQKVKVDFSGVGEAKAFDTIVPGIYNVRVESIDILKAEGKEFPYLKWTLVITSPQCKGLHLYHNTSLAPHALFNLRDTLTALGMQIPKSAVTIDIDKFIGLGFTVETNMRPYNGEDKPNVKKVMPLNAGANPATSEDEDEIVLDLE